MIRLWATEGLVHDHVSEFDLQPLNNGKANEGFVTGKMA